MTQIIQLLSSKARAGKFLLGTLHTVVDLTITTQAEEVDSEGSTAQAGKFLLGTFYAIVKKCDGRAAVSMFTQKLEYIRIHISCEQPTRFPPFSHTLISDDFEMELAISAVTGDIASRFISFLMNKMSNHVCSEEKVERLQQLLLRVQTVVEEADGRYITNSSMLIQLKMLAAAMYRGYHVLDTIKYRQHKEGAKELVSDLSALSFAAPLKRSRTIAGTTMNKVFNLELTSVLENLETAVANMTEFVILLGGCERISRRPYDTYLYMDNFMFGRHSEKQQLFNFLLQHNPPGTPAVLPVIGGRGVGKKTLVAHVCSDERVRSHFSFILHLNGGDIFSIADHERLSGRALVVVEFVSDIDDNDWATFYTSVTSMDRGSKVIILSRIEKLEKFGTIKPIFLNSLACDEFRYLFKTLAFGSANPMDYPELVQIVEEFHMLLGGSLVMGNLHADVLRRNLNVHFWLCKLERARNSVVKNLSMFGAHLDVVFHDQGHPIHCMDFVLSHAAPVPSASNLTNVSKKDLPKVILRDILEDHIVPPPKEAFNLIFWESRIPPYSSIVSSVHFTPNCVDDKPEAPLSRRKRPGLFDY